VAFPDRSGGEIRLWVRDLDSLTPRVLPGAEGGNGPFWSPDGRYIGFRAGGKLKKVEAIGGPVLTLCDTPDVRGATWSTREVIVYTPGNSAGLMRVSAAGGSPSPLIDRNSDERSLRHPWFLPDGRHFLYSAVGTVLAQSAIYVGDLDSADSKSRRLVARVNSNSAYALVMCCIRGKGP
jgi:Tol biopolymer transport system component